MCVRVCARISVHRCVRGGPQTFLLSVSSPGSRRCGHVNVHASVVVGEGREEGGMEENGRKKGVREGEEKGGRGRRREGGGGEGREGEEEVKGRRGRRKKGGE